jgi:hypothetical protein
VNNGEESDEEEEEDLDMEDEPIRNSVRGHPNP